MWELCPLTRDGTCMPCTGKQSLNNLLEVFYWKKEFKDNSALFLECGMATYSSNLAWNIHGWRSMIGYSPWGGKELDMTERLHFHFLECEDIKWRQNWVFSIFVVSSFFHWFCILVILWCETTIKISMSNKNSLKNDAFCVINDALWHYCYSVQFSRSVMSDSSWSAHQASLSITNSRSLLKLMSIE